MASTNRNRNSILNINNGLTNLNLHHNHTTSSTVAATKEKQQQSTDNNNSSNTTFINAMKKLFDIMDDQRTGFVKLADIENRWQEDDGSKGMPKGVIESLRKVTPRNGLLSFERFCSGLKMCLLKSQSRGSSVGGSGVGDLSINTKIHENNKPQRPPSAPILDLEPTITMKSQWNTNNTATVRPNNVNALVQRTLSMPQLNPDTETEINVEPTFLLYGPPKPPRTSLVLERATNNNHLDRLDKAEIRNALQNWQMGQLMNDNEQKLSFNSRFTRGPGDGQHTEFNALSGLYQKRPNNRRREPRRHTLQNGIDYNMLKRLKQIEQEKDVLMQGLSAVEKSREWYLKQVAIVQDKIRFLGRAGGSHVEMWSEAHQERLDLQRARVLEVNRHLNALAESWERGGFPMHMNLALNHHTTSAPYQYPNNSVSHLKQTNHQLNEELVQKNEKLTMLEREKAALIREILSLQRNRSTGNDENVF